MAAQNQRYDSFYLPSEWNLKDYPNLHFYKMGKAAGDYSGFGFSIPTRMVNKGIEVQVSKDNLVSADKIVIEKTRNYTLKKSGEEKIFTGEELVSRFGDVLKKSVTVVGEAAPSASKGKAAKKTAPTVTEDVEIKENPITTLLVQDVFQDEECYSCDNGVILQSKSTGEFVAVPLDGYEFGDDGLIIKRDAAEKLGAAAAAGKRVLYTYLEDAARVLVGGESLTEESLSEADRRAIDAYYADCFLERDQNMWDTIPPKEVFVQEFLRERNWAKYKDYINDFAYEQSTPLAIRNNKQFVVWRFEYYDDDGNPLKKPRKMPYQAKRPDVRAMSNNSATWSDFETACRCAREHSNVVSGVGVMFSNGLMGIDIDGKMDKVTGELEPFAKDIVNDVNSYTEVSPSGTGVHILTFGEVGKGMNNQSLGLEMYSAGRFFTLTGHLFEGQFRQLRKKADAQPVIDAIIKKHFAYKRANVDSIVLPKESLFANDKDLLAKITKGTVMGPKFERLRQGFAPFVVDAETGKPTTVQDKSFLREDGTVDASAVDAAFCKILVFYGASPEQIDRIYRNEPLAREKWDRQLGQTTYGQYTVNRAFAGQTKQYDKGYAYRQKMEQLRKQKDNGSGNGTN